MSTQEQAYIEGFVKRAAEYGFDENEAVEILKEAARRKMRNGKPFSTAGYNPFEGVVSGVGEKLKETAHSAVNKLKDSGSKLKDSGSKLKDSGISAIKKLIRRGK